MVIETPAVELRGSELVKPGQRGGEVTGGLKGAFLCLHRTLQASPCQPLSFRLVMFLSAPSQQQHTFTWYCIPNYVKKKKKKSPGI